MKPTPRLLRSLQHLRDQGVPFRRLDGLKRRDGNPRDNAEAVPSIVESLQAFGWTTPMLVDPTGELEAGDTRYLAASHLGLEEVPVIETEHDERLAKLYVPADNRLGEIAKWSGPKLADLFVNIDASPAEVKLTGWTPEDVSALISKNDRHDDEEDKWNEPPPPATSVVQITKLGDVWQLGRHRIVCGDSGIKETIETATQGQTVNAVVTDPPYAIYGSSTGVSSNVADDRMVVPFFEMICRTAYDVVPWFAHVYLFCDWRSWSAVWEGARRARLAPKNCIVWDKGGGGLGNNYANTHEFVGFFAKIPETTAMKQGGPTGQRPVHRPNIVRENRARGSERPHNASKPVDLVREFIKNSTDQGDRVLDMFGGGGSTLIACEAEGRSAILIDVSPVWVDVMVARWERVTGKKAERITG